MLFNSQQLRVFLQNHELDIPDLLDHTNELANRLIKNLQIQSGFGLAGFLNLDSHFDNYTAVRVWVNKQLLKLQGEGSDDLDWLCEELEHRFYDCVPEMG